MASSFPVGRSPLPTIQRGGKHLSKPGPSKSPWSMIAREKLLVKLHSAGNDLPDAEIPVNTDAGTLPHEEASSVPPAGLLLCSYCRMPIKSCVCCNQIPTAAFAWERCSLLGICVVM